MADFCKQCAKTLNFPPTRATDMADLCADGEIVQALCEECGPCFVDSTGICRGHCDVKGHWDEDAKSLLYSEKPNKKLKKRWEDAT